MDFEKDGLINKGFTLAEVLITLAIIGVVAALTIPSVVKNYQKTQTVTKLKKAYSILNQAYNSSQSENGMYQTWDIGIDIGATEYFDKYWRPYLKVAKICKNYSDCGYEASAPWQNPSGYPTGTSVVAATYRTTFLTPDGILFVIFTRGGNGDINNSVYIDLNGSKGPNRVGKDLFYLTRTDKGVLPFCYYEDNATIDTNCSKEGNGTCCSTKIARDGWEIKDNYPW